jgi:hypothetical protein
VPGKQVVGVNRVQGDPLYEVAVDAFELRLESAGDEVLVGAAGKIRHERNLADGPAEDGTFPRHWVTRLKRPAQVAGQGGAVAST